MRFLLYFLLLISFVLSGQCPDNTITRRVDSLITASRTHTGEGEFPKALATSARAAELALTNCGERSVAYGSATFNEGRVRYFMDDNQAAIPWYQKSLEIRGEVLGTDHPDYGKSLNNLAIVYDVLGRYETAEPLYKAALEIREKTAGRESATFANALANLGSLYQQMGKYEAAEALSLEAKDIRERLLGRDDPAYSASLNNLGNLYLLLRNPKQAAAYFQEAVVIMERAGDTTSADYAARLDNLGYQYYRQGYFGKAAGYYRRALGLINQRFGGVNLATSQIRYRQGELAMGESEWSAARKRFTTVLNILDSLGMRETEDFASTLQKMATVDVFLGDTVTAVNGMRRAAEIARMALRSDHPEFSYYLRESALLEWRYGDQNTTIPTLTEGQEHARRVIQQAVRYLGEDELAPYVRSFTGLLEASATVAESAPAAAPLVYESALLHKGFLLEHRRRLNQILRTTPELSEQFEQLRAEYRLLAQQYVWAPGDSLAIANRRKTIQNREGQLVRHTPALKAALAIPHWRDVANELNPGEVAVEFVTYVPAFGERGELRYAGVCLVAGHASPLFVPLGTQQDFDELLKMDINTLYADDGKGNELYDLIWRPLREAVNGTGEDKPATWYLAAAGSLHQLNFGAIPTPNGAPVFEEFSVVNLSSTRSLALARDSIAVTAKGGEAVLVGGVDYGGAPGQVTARSRSYLTTEGWAFLPWTEVEVATVAELLSAGGYRTQLKTGGAATEKSLKQLASPAILHLATHGFYFPRDFAGFAPPALLVEEPLMRGGLILAGGNTYWTGETLAKSVEEDGVLTALEAAQLDLWGTKLIVLSACDTGLGEIRGDEGVYGLQRALLAAGGQRIVTSLWRIPDYETQEFMREFYQVWTRGNATVREAFDTARRKVRAQFLDPLYWAGFVLLE